MTNPVEIRLDSRYKDTGIAYSSDLSEAFFEMWERPEEIDDFIESASLYLVRNVDVGRLDLLAYEFYGNVRLWWIIATVNNLVDPIGDMYPGQKLYIPAYDQVMRFVSRAGNVVEEIAG